MPFPGGRWLLAWSLAFGLVTSPAHAERSRVALVSPRSVDAMTAEVSSRMQAELAASGFEVIVVATSDDVDARTIVERARTEPGVVATFAVIVAGDRAAVDVWLSDRITGKTTVKRLDPGSVPPARAPAILAIRAVELLRASLLETVVPAASAAVSSSAPVPADVSRFVEKQSARSTDDRRWPGVASFEGGVGALDGFGGLGASFGPVFRFAYRTPVDLLARVTLSGPTLGGDLETGAGSATTHQELGLIEGVYAHRLGRSTALLGSVGFGIYHLQVQGSALPPYAGASSQLWSALFDAGIGGALRVGERSAVVLDVHGLATQREAQVAFANGETRRSGRPIAFVSLGFWAGL